MYDMSSTYLTNTNQRTIRQKLIFLRHGVACHNIAPKELDPQTGHHYAPDLKHEEFTDARLITYGEEQSRKVGKRLKGWLPRIDMVLVSPLTRCLQTASHALQAFYEGGKEGTPPFYCYEDLREAIGPSYANKRSRKSLIQVEFPLVSFDPSMPEEDQHWCSKKHETMGNLLNRVDRFMQSLAFSNQMEGNGDVINDGKIVLIVTHGVWMESCFMRYAPDVLQHGRKRVYNCDLICCEMAVTWEKCKSSSKWNFISLNFENAQFHSSSP